MKIRSALLATVIGFSLAASGVELVLPVDETVDVSIENPLNQEFNATASEAEVNLTWDLSESELASVLIKDGEIVADVSAESEFTDFEVASGEKVSYTLISLLESDAQSLLEHPGSESLDIRHLVVEVPDGYQGVEAQAATLPSSSSLIYRTFIGQQFVPAPGGVCSPDSTNYYFFNGNNRGFSATSGTSKTQQVVNVDWLNNGAMTTSKLVGATTLYWYLNGTYVAIDNKQASSSGINFYPQSHDSGNVSFILAADVKNPFCSPTVTSGIYYSFTVNMNRSGSFTMYGRAITAPNHELYMRDAGLSWTTIFRRVYTSFDCFAFYNSPDCTKNYYYSGTW